MREVPEVEAVLSYANDGKGRFAIGGMASKLQAVKLAVESGVETVIANGRRPDRLAEIVAGDGAAVDLGDTVVVHLMIVRGDNQVVVVNTWEESAPLQIVVAEGQTFPGLFEGLIGAQVGDTLAIAMPPELAFGEQGEPTIGLPAGVDVIAVAEVVGVY